MAVDSDRSWLVYIIECDDGSLYTGVRNDLERRFQMHSSGQGAKYFRSRKPLSVVYTETQLSKSAAHSREYEIKRLSRPSKLQLINR